MANSKRDKTKYELLDEFEMAFLRAKENAPDLIMDIERDRNGISFKVPRLKNEGFDVEATVELYGIYPSAGSWHGAPWEPYDKVYGARDLKVTLWKACDVCAEFFGFVRELLSPSARLRCLYRRSKLKSADIELYDKNTGWTSFERNSVYRQPFGQFSETYQQNELLPARDINLEDGFSPW